MKGSLSELDNRNFTFNFTNNAHRVAKIEWKFVRKDQYCVSQGPAPYYATGLQEWVPDSVSSGSVKRDTALNITCKVANQSDMAATTTIVRTSSVLWDGWFSIAGQFNADLSQQNTSTEKLTFAPDPGATATLCGDNNKPLDADRVKEIS